MKTSDVYLASALLALNYKLVNIDRKDPRHMVFDFGYAVPDRDISEEKTIMTLDAVEKMWVNRSLQVNAFEFAEAIKRMKSIIHSQS